MDLNFNDDESENIEGPEGSEHQMAFQEPADESNIVEDQPDPEQVQRLKEKAHRDQIANFIQTDMSDMDAGNLFAFDQSRTQMGEDGEQPNTHRVHLNDMNIENVKYRSVNTTRNA